MSKARFLDHELDQLESCPRVGTRLFMVAQPSRSTADR